MKTSRRFRWLLFGVGLLLLVLLLLPVLAPFGWHMWYGDTAEFHSWNISVPTGWLIQDRGPALVVTRMPWGYPLARSDLSFAVLVHVEGITLFDMNRAYPIWKQHTLRGFEGQGYRLSQERTLRVADRDSRCLEFVAEQVSRVQIACFHARDSVSASFQGDGGFVEEFYSLLGAVQRVPPPSAPSAGSSASH